MQTVVELDLIGYSLICELLKQVAGVDRSADLNKEVQAFVDIGLERIHAERRTVVMQKTGDGVILVLERPSDAHRFAEAVHEATRRHNERESLPVGKRVFRVGAATGKLTKQARDDGGNDYSGMTIARAVRLEGKSPPGGLLVDPDTWEGLGEEQTKLYSGQERVAGKREEMFTAYRCVMNSNAAKDVEYFLKQAKDKQKVAAIAPATWEKNPFPPSKLPRTGEHLVGRSKELATLTRAWKNPKTKIVQIVAPGGVGKTQLVKKWREGLLDRADPGRALRAFDWSFYSQGSHQQASADDFFDRALRFFGEATPEDYKAPWAKGERLAELVRQQRTLLVLDGMEPLQHPPGPMAGELTDPSIQALLEGLQRDNPGLCIVTTREAVRTLEEMSEPKRLTIDLGRLSPEAGAELLERYGVLGDADELRQAAEDVKGHALALILLGTYLKEKCNGDVAQRSEALLFKGHERYAERAHKVMASYEAWLEREDDIGRAAVAILRLMGLFNHPADSGCLAALRAERPIPGLTDALFAGDRDELWNRAVERLRAARLLADEEGQDAALDAHPLLREHFAAQLAERLPDAAREAHRRLYEHLKQAAPELPDNLNDMMPLYHAVAHGCKAGLWQEALDDVYFRRVSRQQDFFSTKKLGAFGAELSAMSSFFDKLWTSPVNAITDDDKAWVLGQSAFRLRALGRLSESSQPMVGALRKAVDRQQWGRAAAVASNLSDLSRTLGDVSSAVHQGEQSVELADRAGDAFLQMGNRTTLAAALHASGVNPPFAAFREAEAMQQERQPQYPLLYSFQGYRYCDLLLDKCSVLSSQFSVGDSALETVREVRNRAETTLGLYGDHSSMGTLNFALDHLTLGRTYLLEGQWIREARVESAETKAGSVLDSAEYHLNKSVLLLRQAGTLHHLPRGLLHRAGLWRVKYEIKKDKSQIGLAKRDLGEGRRIAERGSMLIWRIEAALERTRLALVLGDREKSREQLNSARQLIRQTEKPYEPHVPDWAEWEPPDYVGVFKKREVVGYHRRDREIAALGEAVGE